MSSTVFPIASTSGGNPSYAVTCAAINTHYKVVQSLSAGTYAVTTSPTSVTAKIQFFSSSGFLTEATTSAGSIVVSLASAVTYYVVYVDSSAGCSVTVTYQSSAVPGTSLSGTLDTITSTSTYNTTGSVYVVALGGGGGGQTGASYGSGNSAGRQGGGGQPGTFATYVGALNTSTSVTIGSGGNSDSSGGTTSFGNLVSAGGGSTGNYVNQSGNGSPGSASLCPWQNVKTGSTGSGGSGALTSGNNQFGGGGSGGGSGIGTGGTGGGGGGSTAFMTGTAGTGYGSGGGGGGAAFVNAGPGGPGAPGVVYILRGF